MGPSDVNHVEGSRVPGYMKRDIPGSVLKWFKIYIHIYISPLKCAIPCEQQQEQQENEEKTTTEKLKSESHSRWWVRDSDFME